MDLSTEIEELSGVGPKTGKALRKVGIKTLRDFFYTLPRDYENYTAPTSIAEIEPGKIVIKGRIEKLSTRRGKYRNITITEGTVRDETGAIRIIWFNQSFREKQLIRGKEYCFTGSYELHNGRYSLKSPSVTEVEKITDQGSGLVPVYVAHGKLKSNNLRRLMEKARGKFSAIPDLLPTVQPGLRREALFRVHFPETMPEIAKARKYLAYEELFELLLAAKLNRQENEQLRAEKIPFSAEPIREFVGKLPFKLTGAQRRVAWEIFQDMDKETPMNRLLQGDVGAGKTVVAAMAAYEAILGGGQVAILAPTAILATQHYEGFVKIFSQTAKKVEIALLTGATKQKSALKQRIANGSVQLVIGTHALLTDNTKFHNLTLVVIDEQHRFGVRQRQQLLQKSPKGLAPHLLTMTATPIPRSLQLTVFGDLNVSILDEIPKGRQPIRTKILEETEMRERLYPEIYQTIQAGQQVYWICRAIEDGAENISTVTHRYKILENLFPDCKVGYLHGKMKPTEKDAIMTDFAQGNINLLVSTTVVEVGVDVPNATLMIIENAEGYGLAQLHQLRGRVGRGTVASSCYLLTESGHRPSRRLRELEQSTNGFHLAEVDLEIRGPGEIYGSLQHGVLDLRIATLTDTNLIYRAQQDVAKFLQKPENMIEYPELMADIKKYQLITTLN